MNDFGYYSDPDLEQLEILEILVDMMPQQDVGWLSENGNLEYYIKNYGRAKQLIDKLRGDINHQ